MAKRSTLSSGARRALVMNFVQQGLVTSQTDLVDLLEEEGIEVTQATASRDLEEVGAVRGRDESGELRYRIPAGEEQIRSKLGRVSSELILNISASGNLVVVKTPAGGAQLLASTLDRASANGELPNLIGTIAGDDTVLAIAKSAMGGANLAKQLQQYLEASNRSRRGAR